MVAEGRIYCIGEQLGAVVLAVALTQFLRGRWKGFDEFVEIYAGRKFDSLDIIRNLEIIERGEILRKAGRLVGVDNRRYNPTLPVFRAYILFLLY